MGEASHPGPLAATVVAVGMLRRVCAAAGSAIHYPRPGDGALRGAIAPGFAQEADGTAGQDEFSLRVEAVNSTGWRTLQRRLSTTSAHVVLAQETWLMQGSIPAASDWARRHGWKTVWTAAVQGPSGGASGGAAILVRDFLGTRYPPGSSHEWVPGRVVAAVLDAPGHRPMMLVSTYLVHGVGPGPANLEILASVGQRVRALQGAFEVLIGGDINMEPPDFISTGIDTELNAVVLCPGTARGTFRAAGAASLLDYFVITGRLAAAVHSVEAVEATCVKGHTPVQLTFKPRATTLRALHLRRAPRLGLDRLYGPLPPTPCWAPAKEAAERALEAARAGSGSAQALLDEAYRIWADTAEEELADFTDEPLKKVWGKRWHA